MADEAAGREAFERSRSAYEVGDRRLRPAAPGRGGRPQYEGTCPAHADRRPSLAVTHDHRGVTCRCRAGCPREDVAAAIGLPLPRWAAARPSTRPGPHGRGRRLNATLEDALAYVLRTRPWDHVATYPYRRRDGTPHFAVLRFRPRDGGPKQFRTAVRRPDGRWALEQPNGARLPLYGLPEVLAADEVWVCEGEQCADRLRAIGLVATTPAFGADAVGRTTLQPLAGRRVVVVPDHDRAGRRWAAAVVAKARRPNPRPAAVTIVDLDAMAGIDPAFPPPAEKADVADWLDGLPPGLGPGRPRALLEAMAARAAAAGPPRWLEEHSPRNLKALSMGKARVTIDPERYLARGRRPGRRRPRRRGTGSSACWPAAPCRAGRSRTAPGRPATGPRPSATPGTASARAACWSSAARAGRRPGR